MCVCSVRSKFVLLLMDRYSHTYIQLTVLVFIHILNHVLTLPNYLSVCVYIHAASTSAPHQRGLDEEESEERGHERHESWTTASHHKWLTLPDSEWVDHTHTHQHHCKYLINPANVVSNGGQNIKRLKLLWKIWPDDFTKSDAGLNEELVQLLLLRDELHVEQDAMLVDIEDLTRWISLLSHLSSFCSFFSPPFCNICQILHFHCKCCAQMSSPCELYFGHVPYILCKL